MAACKQTWVYAAPSGRTWEAKNPIIVVLY